MSKDDFAVLTLLSIKHPTRKGYGVDSLNILETLLGKNWYIYRIHRDSIFLLIYTVSKYYIYYTII